MSVWKKSSPELIAAFTRALPDDASVERRQMFGYPCAFVNGHMAVGLHEERLIARVPSKADAHPCIILGRRMKAYVAIAQANTLTPRAMKSWVQQALEFTASMPPKPAKPVKPVKPKTPARTKKSHA
jgi:TfoX/Sxy family transcriptional regulator of competence genes